MFKNKKYNLMNPENPNSPFFKGNILKQGTVSNYTYNDEVENDNSSSSFSNNSISYSTNSMSSTNDINDDYNSWSNESLSSFSNNSSSSYDYNQEFNYKYSYNGYEKDTCGYDAHKNDIYDNFNGGLYDLYGNNTFNDY